MSKFQYLSNTADKLQCAVFPNAEFNDLLNDKGWEPVPYQLDKHNDQHPLQDVVSIMNFRDVSLVAAWRIYRGLSQHAVAKKLDTTQSAVSQWESKFSKPQKKTRMKLAAIYDCSLEQLTTQTVEPIVG